MATGMARGAKDRGKRIAFGNGRRILWGPHSKEIFLNNPNVALPGHERARDLEWIRYYKGHRTYNTQVGDRWRWNYEFKAQPGEMFFLESELKFAEKVGHGFVVIEPNTPPQKSCSTNKQWPLDRFDQVAQEFRSAGYRVVQFGYGGKHRVPSAELVSTPSFRQALAILARAKLAILPEGGLHHGAAAVGVKAVVLFGGFIPPAVTGYDAHSNLTGGVDACGSLNPCQHCLDAMKRITVDDVLSAANGMLGNG